MPSAKCLLAAVCALVELVSFILPAPHEHDQRHRGGSFATSTLGHRLDCHAVLRGAHQFIAEQDGELLDEYTMALADASHVDASYPAATVPYIDKLALFISSH